MITASAEHVRLLAAPIVLDTGWGIGDLVTTPLARWSRDRDTNHRPPPYRTGRLRQEGSLRRSSPDIAPEDPLPREGRHDVGHQLGPRGARRFARDLPQWSPGHQRSETVHGRPTNESRVLKLLRRQSIALHEPGKSIQELLVRRPARKPQLPQGRRHEPWSRE